MLTPPPRMKTGRGCARSCYRPGSLFFIKGRLSLFLFVSPRAAIPD